MIVIGKETHDRYWNKDIRDISRRYMTDIGKVHYLREKIIYCIVTVLRF